MNLALFLMIVLLAMAVCFCVGVIIWLARRSSRTDVTIFIRGGVDVDTGYPGTGPEDFRYLYKTRVMTNRPGERKSKK